jgi:hypothetical protein
MRVRKAQDDLRPLAWIARDPWRTSRNQLRVSLYACWLPLCR